MAEYVRKDPVLEIMDKVDQYIKEHPEVLERVAQKFSEHFADVKDIALGDKVIWREEK